MNHFLRLFCEYQCLFVHPHPLRTESKYGYILSAQFLLVCVLYYFIYRFRSNVVSARGGRHVCIGNERSSITSLYYGDYGWLVVTDGTGTVHVPSLVQFCSPSDGPCRFLLFLTKACFSSWISFVYYYSLILFVAFCVNNTMPYTFCFAVNTLLVCRTSVFYFFLTLCLFGCPFCNVGKFVWFISTV